MQEAFITRTSRLGAGPLVNPHRFFLLVAPLLFATYALLTPPFQSFDENQHLYRAWQVSTLQWQTERRGAESGGELPRGLVDATIKEVGNAIPLAKKTIRAKPLGEIFATNTAFGLDQPPRFADFKGAAVYSPAGYVPQALTIAVARKANLSVEWTVRAGRLVNASLAVALIGLAIGLIPFGRWVLTMVALLPPTAAAASNFGQDGLLLGATFLLTAVGLKAIADRGWTARSFVIASSTAIAAASIKFVYLPLAALSLLPWPRSGERFKRLLPPLTIMLIGGAVLAFWLAMNASSMAPLQHGLPTIQQQAVHIAGHPLGYLTLVFETYRLMWVYLSLSLYTFGDSTVAPLFSAWLAGMFALALAVLAGDEAAALRLPVRAWLLLLFAVVAVSIATALFITYKPEALPYIPGVQGRYFLPVLPLFGIALMRRGNHSQSLIAGALALLMLSHGLTIANFVQTFYPASSA